MCAVCGYGGQYPTASHRINPLPTRSADSICRAEVPLSRTSRTPLTIRPLSSLFSDVDDLSGDATEMGSMTWTDNALTPTAIQLKQVQGFFKEGRINETQKASLKNDILRKSLTKGDTN